MTELEWQRISKRIGFDPYVDKKDGTCCLLNKENGECKVYNIRPMICRLWGLVEMMKCPHGCVPDKVLNNLLGFEFLFKADEISKERGMPLKKTTYPIVISSIKEPLGFLYKSEIDGKDN